MDRSAPISDLQSATRFAPADVEPRVLARWLESGLFRGDPEGADPEETFSIAIPPPNVTGVLHMGHALNNTIQDVLVRHNRMLGRRVKWILGTDHAGIATQAQVEKQLRREGTSRTELGRERFVERVWEWRRLYGPQIVGQLQRLGASCDYDDEHFTLDPGYVRAVRKEFVELYDQGLIYRDNYLVNWDPGTGSAISDLEVEDREVVDRLYHIDYPLAAGTGAITIATVRPETMLADTAIAVHPDDERYRRLIGETAILPLVGRRLPIIADEFAKPEFGTGALKVTPAHDPNDFEIGRRHNLEQVSVIGEDGRITSAAPERFAGLAIADAHRAVVDALRDGGHLVRSEEYRHSVPFSHRSGERIEPLVSLQWFMAMDELATPAVEVVRDGRVRFHPERWARVYLDWLDNIRPWCISRQLWWGHRLPVWYCDACDETYVALEPPERCGACGDELRQDEDVLDTWFSSALWPFATLGWPDDTPDLRAFYPTSVLSTARDILFLWVARMVMMGVRFPGDIPFTDVNIHSVIQAPDGSRMSKSLGTGIDPDDEIAAHGADAVRFGLLAMSSSQDVRYSAEKVGQGQQLANKLWNASRLVLLRVDPDAAADGGPSLEAIEDRWIVARLQRAKADMAARIAAFDFAHAALGVYDFVYGELCDWYLELVKPRLYAEGEELGAASATLLHVLRETLVLAHPILPFVTEEIWTHVPETEGLLAGARSTPADDALVDPDAEAGLGRVIEAVGALRRWRDTVGAAPGARVPARLRAEGYDATAEHVARLARVELQPFADGAEPVATVAIPGGSVEILQSDAVDLEAASRRAERRRTTLAQEIERAERKLANEGFVAKAPAAIVDREREKLRSLRADLEAL